jgi:3-oxoacyl-[acyl-carrier protein] reductase
MPSSRIAVVTGSARHIGAAIVERLARDGYTVVINYRVNQAAAEQTLARLHTHAPASIAVRADVGKPDEAKQLIDETLQRFGQLDVLVNNAGPWLVKSAFDTSIEEWQRQLNDNLSSAFYCCKFALPALRARRQGCIINFGAANAELARSAPNVAAYHIAKVGVVVLTRSLARTEGPFGIRVNCINPGYIDTAATSDETRRTMPTTIPLRRLGTPAEIAAAVAFLASDEASYINGEVLNVHGGLWV